MYLQARSDTSPNPDRRLHLAVIASRGAAYLSAELCAAAAREGFVVSSFSGLGISYRDMLNDETSDLWAFHPDVVLIAIDATQLNHRARAGSFSHLARQHIGASLIQRTILPLLSRRKELGHLGERDGSDNISISFPKGTGKGEAWIRWSEPAIWRQPKSSSTLLRGNHLARLLSVFGNLSYNCLTIDLGKDPEAPASRDLSAFVADKYQAAVSNTAGSQLDLVLLIDQDPITRKKLMRPSAVYTTRS